jgi:hypothetical protein
MIACAGGHAARVRTHRSDESRRRLWIVPHKRCLSGRCQARGPHRESTLLQSAGVGGRLRRESKTPGVLQRIRRRVHDVVRHKRQVGDDCVLGAERMVPTLAQLHALTVRDGFRHQITQLRSHALGDRRCAGQPPSIERVACGREEASRSPRSRLGQVPAPSSTPATNR